MKVRTVNALFKAVKDRVDEIEVEGALAKKVDLLVKVSPVKWGVFIGCLGLGFGLMPVTGGVPVGVAALPLGVVGAGLGAATSSAFSSLLAVGGVAFLNDIRKYDVCERKSDSIVIKRGH